MRSKLLRLLIVLLISSGVGDGRAKPPLSVLIIDGINNHDWEAGTRAVKAILSSTGRFTVEVSTHRRGKRQKKRGLVGDPSFRSTMLF